MSGPNPDATEAPTPRRLERARQDGQIAQSGDLGAAASLVAGVLVLAAGGAVLGRELMAMTGARLAAAPRGEGLGEALGGVIPEALRLSAPVVGAAALAALVVGGLQAGGLFTFKPLAPTLEKLNPLAGLARQFSLEALVNLGKSLAKLAVVLAVCWMTLPDAAPALLRLTSAPAADAAAWTWGLAMQLATRVAIAYAVLGAADYLWQRHRHFKRLRMTKDEVKREYKEQEGDPQHKAERRRLHQEILRHSMVEAVRRADCVIVNPEHVAVALRFDEATMAAPAVVAKGEDLVAAQIREVARQFGVPIYRDVPLARALNALELGDEIPEALYEAVAEILRVLGKDGAP